MTRVRSFSRASRQLHIYFEFWLVHCLLHLSLHRVLDYFCFGFWRSIWKPLQEIERTNINYFCYGRQILSPPQIPFQGGVQISPDYNSSASYSYHSGADKTRTMLQWITWPFKSLANVLAVLFNCLVDIALKASHCVVWPFRFLKNQTVALCKFVTGLCSSLDQKIQKQFEDPIKIIEAFLEVIWMVVSPFVRAVTWLCEIIITVKRYIKVGK